ncbi:MAG: S1 family peptidase [Enterobacteriaceae bacterium]
MLRINSTYAISGGQNAISGEFPFFAAIARHQESPSKDNIYCGGVLINFRWVLTANHCVENKEVKDIRVILGKYTLLTTTPGEITLSVERVFSYHGWESDTDLALIRLAQDAPMVFEPIEFEPAVLTHTGLVGTVVGFGRITTQSKPAQLQKLQVPIVSDESCSFPQYRIDHNIQFCAGYFHTSVSTHHGDSGGPFIFYWEGVPMLLGIYSDVCLLYPGFHNDSWPGLYTKLSYFYPWILSTMCQNGGPC